MTIPADLIQPLYKHLEKIESKKWDDLHVLEGVTINLSEKGCLRVSANVADEILSPDNN